MSVEDVGAGMNNMYIDDSSDGSIDDGSDGSIDDSSDGSIDDSSDGSIDDSSDGSIDDSSDGSIARGEDNDVPLIISNAALNEQEDEPTWYAINNIAPEYETFEGTKLSKHASLREEEVDELAIQIQREFPTMVDPGSELYQLQWSYVRCNSRLKKLHRHLPILKTQRNLAKQELETANTERDKVQFQMALGRLDEEKDKAESEIKRCYTKLYALDKDNRIKTRFDRWKRLSRGKKEDLEILRDEVKTKTREELQEIFRIWDDMSLSPAGKKISVNKESSRGRAIWEVLTKGEWQKGSCFFYSYLLDVQEEGEHRLPALLIGARPSLVHFAGITRRSLAIDAARGDNTRKESLQAILNNTNFAKMAGKRWGQLKNTLKILLLDKPQDIGDVDDNEGDFRQLEEGDSDDASSVTADTG